MANYEIPDAEGRDQWRSLYDRLSVLVAKVLARGFSRPAAIAALVGVAHDLLEVEIGPGGASSYFAKISEDCSRPQPHTELH